MKTLILVIVSFISTITFSQTTTTWLGGAPGNDSNWNDARNWSNHNVPDEETHVIVKYTNSGLLFTYFPPFRQANTSLW